MAASLNCEIIQTKGFTLSDDMKQPSAYEIRIFDNRREYGTEYDDLSASFGKARVPSRASGEGAGNRRADVGVHSGGQGFPGKIYLPCAGGSGASHR